MIIKFNIDNTDTFYTVTKNDQYGFNFNTHTKALKPDAKKPYNVSTLFYPTLSQVASQVAWLGLQGDGIQDVVDSMVALSERLTETLEKMEGSSNG